MNIKRGLDRLVIVLSVLVAIPSFFAGWSFYDDVYKKRKHAQKVSAEDFLNKWGIAEKPQQAKNISEYEKTGKQPKAVEKKFMSPDEYDQFLLKSGATDSVIRRQISREFKQIVNDPDFWTFRQTDQVYILERLDSDFNSLSLDSKQNVISGLERDYKASIVVPKGQKAIAGLISSGIAFLIVFFVGRVVIRVFVWVFEGFKG